MTIPAANFSAFVAAIPDFDLKKCCLFYYFLIWLGVGNLLIFMLWDTLYVTLLTINRKLISLNFEEPIYGYFDALVTFPHLFLFAAFRSST